MNKDLIRKLYFNSWVRIPIKFIIVFSSIKIGYDYYEYRTAWRTRRGNPRSLGFHEQSPITPYIPTPYLFYQNYEEYMDIKRYCTLQSGIIKTIGEGADRYYLYFDAPCRESTNGIDRFFVRAKPHCASEKAKFYFLDQLVTQLQQRHKKKGRFPKGSTRRFAKLENPSYTQSQHQFPNFDYFTRIYEFKKKMLKIICFAFKQTRFNLLASKCKLQDLAYFIEAIQPMIPFKVAALACKLPSIYAQFYLNNISSFSSPSQTMHPTSTQNKQQVTTNFIELLNN